MAPLAPAQVAKYGLPAGSWVAAEVRPAPPVRQGGGGRPGTNRGGGLPLLWPAGAALLRPRPPRPPCLAAACCILTPA